MFKKSFDWFIKLRQLNNFTFKKTMNQGMLAPIKRKTDGTNDTIPKKKKRDTKVIPGTPKKKVRDSEIPKAKESSKKKTKAVQLEENESQTREFGSKEDNDDDRVIWTVSKPKKKKTNEKTVTNDDDDTPVSEKQPKKPRKKKPTEDGQEREEPVKPIVPPKPKRDFEKNPWTPKERKDLPWQFGIDVRSKPKNDAPKVPLVWDELFKDKVVFINGDSTASMTRKELEEFIKGHGGVVRWMLTASVNYVLECNNSVEFVSENARSKGICIYTEADFDDLLRRCPPIE